MTRDMSDWKCRSPARLSHDTTPAVRHDRSVVEAIVRSHREWPWGLVVVGDPADNEPLPTVFGDADVVSTRATFVCKIQHEVDGEATVEVALDGPDRSGLSLAHEG